MTEELRDCPHCGKQNLPTASRCVHCGLDLEEFFTFDGQNDSGEAPLVPPGEEEGLPELLRDLQRPDLGGIFGEPHDGDTKPIGEGEQKPASPAVPEWLSRVRERAKVEGPSGEPVRKTGANDSEKIDRDRVSQEFDAWIARLQESARREAMLKAKAAQPSSLNEEGVPDWLQRVRELRPKPEEQPTEEVSLKAGEADEEPKAWDSGWSEEDLEKLRRGEYEEPDKPAGAPSEVKETAAVIDDEQDKQVLSEGEPADSDQCDWVEAEEPPIEHQIADFDEEPMAEDQIEPEMLVEPAEFDEAADLEGTDEVVESEPTEPNPEDASEKKETEDLHPDLLLLKSQYERANLLKQLIDQEGKASFMPRLNLPARGGVAQIILALLMLIGVIGGVLIGDAVWPRPGAPAVAAAAFKQSLESLNPGDKVLVVFDYQPAASADIEPGVAAVVRTLQEKRIELTLRTTQPAGLWLTDSLRSAFGLETLPEPWFIPGGLVGMLKLALYSTTTPVIHSDVPDSGETVVALNDFARVLVVTDASLSVSSWMEQISHWLTPSSLLMIAPSQEAVTLSVYYDSGQLGGYLAGMRDFASFDKLSAFNAQVSYRAYQVGLLIMIMLLLLGFVAKADHDADRKSKLEAH